MKADYVEQYVERSLTPVVDWICPHCGYTWATGVCPRATECPKCGAVPKMVGEPEPEKLTPKQERERQAMINRHYPLGG